MNRRQKIIVSITGIFIVLLALVGLTYAYFLTRITGNENDKSISVTTANLELVYDDGTPIIENTILSPITSNELKTKAFKKTFSIAKAASSANIYAKLELSDIVISDNLKDYDFRWALYQGETKVTTGTFVQAMDGNKIILANNILVNSTTPIEYDLYLWINETGVDQSELMGGSFTARIEPSGSGKKLNTLASNILGESDVNVEQGDVTKSEIGFPTYYYSGTSATHYVNFGGILWQIVRVNEDGTIKLMTVDPISDYTLVDRGEPNYTNSTIKTAVENWYNKNIGNNPNLDDKVVVSTFCNDISDNYNGAANRINNNTPTYVCPADAVKVYSKVGLITADEAKLAGSYLGTYYWTLTPSTNASAYYFASTGLESNNDQGTAIGARAVINLSPDVIVSRGNGQTGEQAYEIAENADSVQTVFELNATKGLGDATSGEFSRTIRTYPNGSTVVLKNGTFSITLFEEYHFPENLTIVGGENAVITGISFAKSDDVVEGLTLSNLTFKGGIGIYSERSLKDLTVSNCTFEDGSGIRIGAGTNAASRTNENITIKNNEFSGTLKTYSQVQLAYVTGITTVDGNKIYDGRNSVQLSPVSGTANITNNIIADSSDAAFRIGIVSENTNINIVGNTINNAVKPSTGAIARIGSNSGLPASSTITIIDNTYDGASWSWPDKPWSNVTAEFGINKDGENVES